MTNMTELEAWKVIYAWAKTVPASADPQFKEARTILRKVIKRVEKANNDPAAAWRLIHEAIAAQGHVLVWAASAEEVRSSFKMHTGGQELPAGFSDKEIVKKLKSYVGWYGRTMSFRSSMEYIESSVARDLATRAGLKWK